MNQKKRKKKYSGQQQKEIDCDEPHPTPNEKTQPIWWTERPTGALVGANSLWPFSCCSEEFQFQLLWAYWFYHNHTSISKRNYSKEWRN
jgi:hypothetical protein